MIGYISMIVGLAIVMVLMMRDWSPLVVGIAAAAAVILLNWLPFSSTMTDTYFTQFCGTLKAIFPALFSGSLLAQIYSRSGAVVTIADKMTNLMFRENTTPTRKYISAILSMVAVCGLVCYCGMNSLVALIAAYPIALRVMERAKIPKKFVMGILTCGVYTFAMCGPGSAEIVNILAMQALGTPSYAGLCGGIAAIITEIVVTTTVLTIMIRRSVARGETFAYGPKDIVTTEDKKKPGMVRALTPLLLLFVLFNIFSFDIFTSTMIAWVLSIILLFPYIKGKEEMLESFTEGGKMAFMAAGAVASIVSFTAVIQLLPQFQAIMNGIFNLNVPAAVILILSVCIVACLTGSSSSAVRVAVPIVAARCQEAGLSLGFIHRVSCFASSIIDTTPWSAAVIITLNIADINVKDGYPPVFVATCFATLCGTIVCAVFMTLFPMLP